MREFNAHRNVILSSSDNSALLASATYMRKLLSVETNPALDLVVSKPQLVARLCDLIISGGSSQVQFEAAWAVTNISSGNSSHCAAAMSHGAHSKFLHVLVNSTNLELKEQCVWGLGNIAGDGVHARDMCLGEGALDAILTCFPHHNAAAPHPPRSFLRNAAWAMSNMLRGTPQPAFDDSQRDAMACLCRLVMDATGRAQGKPWSCASGDDEVLVDAAWGLSYLTNGSNDRLSAIVQVNSASGACPGVINSLVQCLGHEKSTVRTPALRTVGNIVTGDSQHVKAVMQAGFLDRIVPLLTDMRKAIRKEACWALSNVTADTDDHKQLCLAVPGCAAALLTCSQDSLDVAKEAAYVVANLFEQSSSSVIIGGLAAGFLGVLLACKARHGSATGNLSSVCDEGLRAISTAAAGSSTSEDAGSGVLPALWNVVNTPVYINLLHFYEEKIELEEVLDMEYPEEVAAWTATEGLTLDELVAQLASQLEGTAPVPAFGAGSGAKGKSNDTTRPSDGMSNKKNNASATAAAAVAAPAPPGEAEPELPLASVELAPDNVSDSASQSSDEDDEVPP